MTSINEIDEDEHLKTTFLEFIEAFFRVADLISYPPLDYFMSSPNGKYDPKDP